MKYICWEPQRRENSRDTERSETQRSTECFEYNDHPARQGHLVAEVALHARRRLDPVLEKRQSRDTVALWETKKTWRHSNPERELNHAFSLSHSYQALSMTWTDMRYANAI